VEFVIVKRFIMCVKIIGLIRAYRSLTCWTREKVKYRLSGLAAIYLIVKR